MGVFLVCAKDWSLEPFGVSPVAIVYEIGYNR